MKIQYIVLIMLSPPNFWSTPESSRDYGRAVQYRRPTRTDQTFNLSSVQGTELLLINIKIKNNFDLELQSPDPTPQRSRYYLQEKDSLKKIQKLTKKIPLKNK